MPFGGDDTDQNDIVELLASFASLKFLIELVLKKQFTTLSTTPNATSSTTSSTTPCTTPSTTPSTTLDITRLTYVL